MIIMLPQMTGYVNKFDKHDNKLNKNGNKSNKSSNKFNKNATMSVRVNNKQLLKNYNKIWEKKFENLMNIDFENKPVYGNDEKYINTKIKIYADGVITNFTNF